MDELDEDLVAFLEKNPRASNVEIASALHVSEGTIRNRVAKLLDSQLVSFKLELSSNYGFKAIVLIHSNPQLPTSDLVEKLLKLKPVKHVLEVSGEWDVAIHAFTHTPEEFNSFIETVRTMKGVEKTESLIVLKENK